MTGHVNSVSTVRDCEDMFRLTSGKRLTNYPNRSKKYSHPPRKGDIAGLAECTGGRANIRVVPFYGGIGLGCFSTFLWGKSLRNVDDHARLTVEPTTMKEMVCLSLSRSLSLSLRVRMSVRACLNERISCWKTSAWLRFVGGKCVMRSTLRVSICT